MARLSMKISPKVVYGNVKRAAAQMLVDNVQQKLLYRVLGSASGIGTGESDNGVYTYFKGSFLATNYDTGEEFRAGKAFMPGAASTLLEGALSGDVTAVEFAFDVGIELDETSATGYVYTVESLLKPTQEDPLLRLSSSLPKAHTKTIAAPVASTTHKTETHKTAAHKAA